MSNKHTKSDLLQMQALPLSAKIRMSQQRIKDWYEHWDGQVYVSFSGGKDSTVLKHLVETTVGDVPSLFVNTGLEYPEIQKFAMNQPNVVTIRPFMRFDEVIKKYGYPVVSKEQSHYIRDVRNTKSEKLRQKRLTGDDKGRFKISEKHKYLINAPFKISDQCCDIMKKKPAAQYEKETGRKSYIGTLASESKLRLNRWMKQGCNAFENSRPISQPLSFWTENDILQYIKEFNLSYCSIYGDIVEEDTQLDLFGKEVPKLATTGVKRTGCMFCMFGLNRDGCPNRFQKMKESHPNQYKYCMKDLEEGGLGLKKVLEFMGEEYE